MNTKVSGARRQFLTSVAKLGPLAVLGSAGNGSALAGADASEPHSRTLRIRGARLHYLEWGSRRSPCMLLLHPAPFNARMWRSFAPLMAHRYHVVAPDFRGFGESDWSDHYDSELFVGDLRALITRLRLAKPVICGNSLGGTAAYLYAGTYPSEVSRLIVMDVAPPQDAGAANGSANAAPPPRPVPIPEGPFKSAEAAAAMIPPFLGEAFAREMIEQNLRRMPDGSFDWIFDRAGTLQSFPRSVNDPRKWPAWNAITCPTLVLRGERSPAVAQDWAEHIVQGRANFELAVIPGAGHFIALDAPQAFAATVKDWLSR